MSVEVEWSSLKLSLVGHIEQALKDFGDDERQNFADKGMSPLDVRDCLHDWSGTSFPRMVTLKMDEQMFLETGGLTTSVIMKKSSLFDQVAKVLEDWGAEESNTHELPGVVGLSLKFANGLKMLSKIVEDENVGINMMWGDPPYSVDRLYDPVRTSFSQRLFPEFF